MCIEPNLDLELYGMDDINSYAFNVDLIACRDCDNSKEDLLDYLKSPELIILYNN